MQTLKLRFFLAAIILFFFFSCAEENKPNISEIAKDYFDTYKERKDFDKFMAFYDENVVLEDIINADRIVGKEALVDFLDWNNPDFQKLDNEILIIYDQIIEERKVVASGYFKEFKWGSTKFEAMHFVTILTFNESGKITKHTDWINYPSNLIDYEARKNSNEWIK